MSAKSSAFIKCKVSGKPCRYSFAGVTSVDCSLTLGLVKDASQGADIVNGARNQPDKIVLSVVESDAEHGSGSSGDKLKALAFLKENRILCTVYTFLGTWKRMLLTEISARQDETSQCGWNGTLSFTQYVSEARENPAADKEKKKNNNSSAKKNTGSSGVKQVPDAGGLAGRAGVWLKETK